MAKKAKTKEAAKTEGPLQSTPPDSFSRDDQVAFHYFINARTQSDIAKDFGVCQKTISSITRKYKADGMLRERLLGVWQKDITMELRRKANETLHSIVPDKIPEGSKAQTVGILIDKARLLSDESTQNVSYADMTKSIKALEAEEEEIKRKLGIN